MINNNWPIQLVNQQNDKSCVVACMAMVAGKTFDEAMLSIVDFTKPPLSEEAMMIGLVRMGVLPRKQLENQLVHGRVYIAHVPSLNNKGSMHAIVMDFRDVFEVYDPQTGREGKLHYTKEKVKAWANMVYVQRVL